MAYWEAILTEAFGDSQRPLVSEGSMWRSPISKKRWGVFALVGAVVLFWLFNVSRASIRPAGCLDGCAAPGARLGETLSIVSWNMLHGYPDFSNLEHRLDVISRLLQEYEADIILLQEVPHTWRQGNAAAYLAEELGMNYAYARANGNRRAIFFEEGSAILSRFPLAEARVWELAPQAGFFEHRIVLSALVVSECGRWRVYATHLTNGDREANQEQAEYLRSMVGLSCDGACFVGGDFNAEPESQQIKDLKTEWIDSFTAFAPDGAGYTCCLDAEAAAATPSKRIDYLFVTGRNRERVDIIEAHTLPTAADWLEEQGPADWPSDHLGVLVRFRLRQ